MIKNKFKIWDTQKSIYVFDGVWFTKEEAEDVFITDRHECHGAIYRDDRDIQVRGESYSQKKIEDTLARHRDWTAETRSYWTNEQEII